MVWGGMIALSTIAGLQADKIFPHVDAIIKTMDTGSIITNDAGIKTLTEIATRKEEYHHRIVTFPARAPGQLPPGGRTPLRRGYFHGNPH